MADVVTTSSELERLAALHKSGALTATEFEAQKARVLGSPVGARPVADGINDGWVYALIALPLVTAALVFARSSGNGVPPVAFPLFVFANAAFTLFDAAKLDTAGRALQPWQFIPGFFVSPIYLFFRARKLGRGYGYAGWYLAELLLVLVGFPFLYFVFLH